MAEALRGDFGGIYGLLDIYDEHREAVEYDLITLGLRWRDVGSKSLTWRDAWVVASSSPRTSALARAIQGDAAEWGTTDYLLAIVADVLQGANYQRGGGKGRKPKPIQRPGKKPQGESQHFGADPLPLEQMTAWLGWDKKPTEDPCEPPAQ